VSLLTEGKMSNTDELQGEILPPCCNLSAAAVERYSAEGLSLIHSFLPDARTVLVLGHHIRASLEWAWFPLAAERGGNTCAADLHAKSVMEAIERQLMLSGHKSAILPYPNDCGISFKRLAAQTGMGELGESFLFLHHTWGPWVHLRVLLTDALVADGKWEPKEICTHCGKCIEACPGKALSVGNHDQQACGRCQQSLRDSFMINAEYRYKCEVCARVCPVGEAPQEIVVQDKNAANQAEHRIADKPGSR
jgi:epoxyqueuosine reductase